MKPYTYKITFEDGTYYFGVRYTQNRTEEFDIGKDYFSSSKVVHSKLASGMPALYEVTKIFDLSQDALEHERTVLTEIISDPNCLNKIVPPQLGDNPHDLCSIGGKLGGSKGGKKAVETHRKNKTGMFMPNNEFQKMGSKAGSVKGGLIGGPSCYKQQKGMFSFSKKRRKEVASNGGKRAKEVGGGIFSLSKEQRHTNALRAAETKRQRKYERYANLVTGQVSYMPEKDVQSLTTDWVHSTHEKAKRKKFTNKEGKIKMIIPNTLKAEQAIKEGYYPK